MITRGNAIINIDKFQISNELPFVLFGGMNVIESRDTAMNVAETYIKVTERLGIPLVFKASFDKANRSSHGSFRGPGLDQGLSLPKARNFSTILMICSGLRNCGFLILIIDPDSAMARTKSVCLAKTQEAE